MLEAGINTSSQYSKSVDDIPVERIGTVITLCGGEVCSVFPGEVRRLHWPLQAPACTLGSEEEGRGVFRHVRDQIREKVSAFFSVDSHPG